MRTGLEVAWFPCHGYGQHSSHLSFHGFSVTKKSCFPRLLVL